MFKGRQQQAKLGELMEAVTEYGTRTAEQASLEYGGDGDMAPPDKRRSFNLSAGLATLVSVVALLFSGFSFYETVLKQANLRIYSPPLIHMYREGYRDVLAIPVTISNDGAQRGTILSFDLTVKHRETNKVVQFQSLNFGDSPKGNKRLFNAITIPGRSSYSDVILFYALETGAFMETTGGVKLPLRLTLKANMDQGSAPEPVTFDMTANYIAGFPDMERGTPTRLYDERWQNSNVKSGG